QAALDAFDARLTAGREQLAKIAPGEKVVFLRVLPAEIRVYGTASPTGALLYQGLGLTPSAITPVGEHAASISMELIPDIDADHIFLLDQTEDAMATIK